MVPPTTRTETYKPGSIRRIYLHNFLTYSDVEIKPGPRLNVVVGPNGTGKSSILCAICLGLGGQPTLLGRADDARLFIMHEKPEAVIEIELEPHEGGETHIIRREIDRSKGSEQGKGKGASTYFINDEKVNLKAVKKLVSEDYGIAVDNLCTFLPQDKVGNFSGFNYQALLCETEKSLGANLYEKHQKLIQLEGELKSSGTTVETIADRLKALEDENERLEREKERMEEREELQKKVDLYQKKKMWLEFDSARDKAIEIKNEKERAKQELNDARKSLQPLEQMTNRAKERVERSKAKTNELARQIGKFKKDSDQFLGIAENSTDEIEEVHAKLSDIDRQQRNAQIVVEKLEKAIEETQEDLTKYPPEDQVEVGFREASRNLRQIKEALNAKEREKKHVYSEREEIKNARTNAEMKLERMNDEKARRKERIFRQNPHLQESFSWIDQNRKSFRRPVLGPIATEIVTTSGDTAAYLEQHVANNVLKMYVVECKEDYNLLFDECRRKRRIPINILIVPMGKVAEVKRMYSSHKMDALKKEHGVVGYLDDTFSAPGPIMQALRTMSRVDKVLVGSEKTQESIDRHNLLEFLSQREDGKPDLMSSCIFTRHNDRTYKYTSQVSRYSKKLGQRVDEITPARMLAPGTRPEQKQELKDSIIKLRDEEREKELILSDLDSQTKDIMDKGKEFSNEVKRIKDMKAEIKAHQNKLSSKMAKLEDAKKVVLNDHAADKRAQVKKLKDVVLNSIKSMEKASETHEKHVSLLRQLTGIKMTEDGLVDIAQKLVDTLEDRKKITASLETTVAQRTHELTEAKKKARLIKSKAEKEAPLQDNRGNALPLKEQLMSLTVESLPDLEAALDEFMVKINEIHDNPEVLRQYQERKEEIEKTKREMEGLNQTKSFKQNELGRLSESWESALVNTVEKVNVLFKTYFSELGCSGEIGLVKGESNQPRSRRQQNEGGESEKRSNFKDWGIEIRVKFREKGSLQPLSAERHSGGERSVSTIMYLMALQELMISPFRCVDEINQGLDERNERLVFRRIVNNSTSVPQDGQGHSGQYFLITPKLLPNLTDMENEDVTILFVFNGPFNFGNFRDWDVNSFLKGSGLAQQENTEESEEEVVSPRRGKRQRPSVKAEDEENDQEEIEIPRKRSPRNRGRRSR